MRPSVQRAVRRKKVITAERKFFCYATVKEYVSKSKKNMRARKTFLIGFRENSCVEKKQTRNLSINTPAS